MKKSWTITSEQNKRNIEYLAKLRADRNKWKNDCRQARKQLRQAKAFTKDVASFAGHLFKWARKHGYEVKDPFELSIEQKARWEDIKKKAAEV